MIDSRITTTRNSVPQRGWAVGYLRISSGTSGLSASSAWIVMCSAPWYWKTRWMSGVRLISGEVADEDRDPDQALDEVLDEVVLDVARS